VPQKLQRFYENTTGMVYFAPGCPWNDVYAPSRIGTLLQKFTFGHARL
jgi:hypothetical protein